MMNDHSGLKKRPEKKKSPRAFPSCFTLSKVSAAAAILPAVLLPPSLTPVHSCTNTTYCTRSVWSIGTIHYASIASGISLSGSEVPPHKTRSAYWGRNAKKNPGTHGHHRIPIRTHYFSHLEVGKRNSPNHFLIIGGRRLNYRSLTLHDR